MKITRRLSSQFNLITAVLLILFSGSVYYFSSISHKERFIINLNRRALNTARLLATFKEIDTSLLKKIHQTTLSWSKEEIIVTDTGFRTFYSHNVDYLKSQNLISIVKKGETKSYRIKEKVGVFYYFREYTKEFYVFVIAFDDQGRENLSDLRKILIWSVLFSLIIVYAAAYIFARRAVSPISGIIDQVKKISATRLSDRVRQGKSKDEISELAGTFNEMLAKLEMTFNNQGQFINHISHEFRTPLAVMIAEADYMLTRDRTLEEYKDFAKNIIGDLKKLNKLTNSLLEMAEVSNMKEIPKITLRVDELLLSSLKHAAARYPDRKIITDIRIDENRMDEFLIWGNEGLLGIVFRNLVDNACKYSGDIIYIRLYEQDREIFAEVEDSGIGIEKADLEKLFTPFFRAENTGQIRGHGIGLPLVNRIIQLHDARLIIDSVKAKGTKITVVFQKAGINA